MGRQSGVFFLALLCPLFLIAEPKSDIELIELEPHPQGKYLIRLSSEPLLAGPLTPATFRRTSIEDVKRFRTVLRKERADFKAAFSALAGSRGKIRFEYELLWNGVSVEIPSHYLEQLASLPGVREVFPVGKVSIPESGPFEQRSLEGREGEELLPPLSIPKIWEEKNLRGNGIRIAVIDTGVDYRHPDLGNCFGPPCKVEAGIDLVNHDSDPRDDQGHGTHVAGIASGNGSKMGVAPDAKIIAIKVLNSFGGGTLDTVMKGMEFAIDPNEDGDFKDAAHVLNLSLGGPGETNSPMERVTNLVAQYAIVVAAAGNSSYSGRIGLPGGALQALTVAASDGDTKIADFSNAGPTFHQLSKPDIAAPGVAILSTLPDGKYGVLSGTSMATPFIAGLVALILEDQKTHSGGTDRVKALLAQGAIPLPYQIVGGDTKSTRPILESFLLQGAGLVQPLSVLSDSFGVYLSRANEKNPGSGVTSHLGIHHLSEKMLKRLVTLEFQCDVASKTAFSVSLEHDLGATAKVVANPSQFDCLPSSSFAKRVDILISQTTQGIPLNLTYPHAKGVLATFENVQTHKQLKIPVPLFPKALHRLHLKKSEKVANTYGYLINEALLTREPIEINYVAQKKEDFQVETWVDPGKYTELIGGYDIWAKDPKIHIWIKSGVSLEGTFDRDLKSSALVSQREIELYGPDGKKDPSLPLSVHFFSKVLPPKYTSPILGRKFSMKFEPGRAVAVLSAGLPSSWEGYAYLTGIENDKTYFAAEQLEFASGVGTVALPKEGYYESQLVPLEEPEYFCSVFGFWQREQKPMPDFPFAILPTPGFGERIFVGRTSITHREFAEHRYFTKLEPSLTGTLACFSPHKKSLFVENCYDGSYVLSNVKSQKYLQLGDSLHIGSEAFVLADQASYFTKWRFLGLRVNMVSGQNGEYWYAPTSYELKGAGGVIEQGKSPDSSLSKRWKLDSGKYTLTRNAEYLVQGEKGYVASALTFEIPSQLTGASLSFPSLRHLVWGSEGDQWTLYFDAFSWGEPALTLDAELFLRERGKVLWEAVDIDPLGGVDGIFFASVPKSRNLADYELKLKLVDDAKNELVLQSTHPFLGKANEITRRFTACDAK